ncbi:TetR/AcrR family transcriptional regulator; helix-turn-helix transcriptional regulator [Streptomyces sp. J2-1]|uniref:TetR/AcrR family transcriptional regulator n=1 Tax=Streptomyces corallincola TaxID=2851888 RepID=UPI001C37EAC7|nr:TetR/AcrR family transcriptional regulator [Streptomyces corallincola]MBV2357067.1 TetR/AcrR family transcriptional regulator; helix-turn-helix transcriptional regulator [Streptomyces corallincola]
MARTKEFDPDTALRAAVELFWQQGYEATSMADLVAHLGVGRASLYATFGSKHDLYLKALDHYTEANDTRLLEELSRPGPALPAVRAVVRRFAEESAGAETASRGCFVTNTAAELCPHDPEAARRAEASWARLETLLHAALSRARAQGEIPADRDPRALARMLLVLMQGLRVAGKCGADAGRSRDAAEQALRALD